MAPRKRNPNRPADAFPRRPGQQHSLDFPTPPRDGPTRYPTDSTPATDRGTRPANALTDRFSRSIGPAADGVVSALLPQTCAACAAPLDPGGEKGLARALCPACCEQVQSARQVTYCPRCARTARPMAMGVRNCGRCRTEDFWNVKRIVRVAAYSAEPLRQMLIGLKYAGLERTADVLGGLLADALAAQPWTEFLDALVPVPMHPLRRWQRPCNHAEVLADAVGRRLGIAVQRAAVRRSTYGPSQTVTSRSQRFANIRGCFAAARSANVADGNICIIDNITTTGATLHEVSKVLRRAGARRIHAAIVARANLAGDFQPEISELEIAAGR